MAKSFFLLKILSWFFCSLCFIGLANENGDKTILRISEPLNISAQKSPGPFFAYRNLQNQNDLFQKQRFETSSVLLETEKSVRTKMMFQKRIILSPITLNAYTAIKLMEEAANSKSIALPNIKNNEQNEEWMNQLSYWKKLRLTQAQKRYGVLSKELNKKNIDDAENIINDSKRDNLKGRTILVSNLVYQNISGAIEIKDGLALTGEHSLEVFRSAEGEKFDIGKINIQEGNYSLKLSGTVGEIVALLIDGDGHILGEGGYRLNETINFGSDGKAPKIQIYPVPRYAASAKSLYGPSADSKNNKIIYYSENSTEKTSSESEADDKNHLPVDAASVSLAEATMEGHLNSLKIISPSQAEVISMIPDGMARALKEIVSERLKYNLLGGEVPIIWGKVLDKNNHGKSGVEVILESDVDLPAIYFNKFMLPDEKISSTSENGYFAFVGPKLGFQSILVKSDGKYYSHSNVYVEPGKVSIADAKGGQLLSEVVIRSYDAFSREPISSGLAMQNIENKLHLDHTGTITTKVPQESRLSLAWLEATGDYPTTQIPYVDSQPFIHLPRVKNSWIENFRNNIGIEKLENTGVLVGFINQGEYDAFLADRANQNSARIVYFNQNGEKVDDKEKSWGFVIFNLPIGTYETVILNKKTGKIFTRVLPVDSGSLQIINY